MELIFLLNCVEISLKALIDKYESHDINLDVFREHTRLKIEFLRTYMDEYSTSDERQNASSLLHQCLSILQEDCEFNTCKS